MNLYSILLIREIVYFLDFQELENSLLILLWILLQGQALIICPMILSALIICPRYIILCRKNSHLSGCSFKFVLNLCINLSNLISCSLKYRAYITISSSTRVLSLQFIDVAKDNAVRRMVHADVRQVLRFYYNFMFSADQLFRS